MLPRIAGGALIIQLAATGTSFLAQIVLVKAMGSAQYGVYSYVIAWADLVGLIASLGMAMAVLRFASQYVVHGDEARLHGFLRFSHAVTLAVGLLLALVVAGGAALAWRHGSPLGLPLLVGMVLLPLSAMMQLQSETLRAFRRIPLSLFTSRLLLPVAQLILGLWLWLKGWGVASLGMIGLTAAVYVAACTVQRVWIRRHAAPPTVFAAKPLYDVRAWMAAALPMCLINISSGLLTKTDMLLLGFWVSPKELGIYSVALKISAIAGFVLSAVNSIAAPTFAELHARSDLEGLQAYVATAAHWIFWPTLIGAGLLVACAKPLLSLFGPEFQQGWLPMLILIGGQIVNVGAGSVGYLLIMTGRQGRCAAVYAISAVLNIIIQAILVPRWGICGSAIGTASTMALWNIWLHFDVARLVGVRPSIISSLRRAYSAKAVDHLP